MVQRLGMHGANATIPQAIEKREEFATSGAMMGEYSTFGLKFGSLPKQWQDELLKHQTFARDNGEALYVVYSYDTPIAWYHPNIGWTKPPVKYSLTTSKHQGKLYLAK